jgi:hypothetical protein
MSENNFRKGNELFFKDMDAIFKKYLELKNDKNTSEIFLNKVYEESLVKMSELLREYYNPESKFEVARTKAYFEKHGMEWNESTADILRWCLKEHRKNEINNTIAEEDGDEEE